MESVHSCTTRTMVAIIIVIIIINIIPSCHQASLASMSGAILNPSASSRLIDSLTNDAVHYKPAYKLAIQ